MLNLKHALKPYHILLQLSKYNQWPFYYNITFVPIELQRWIHQLLLTYIISKQCSLELYLNLVFTQIYPMFLKTQGWLPWSNNFPFCSQLVDWNNFKQPNGFGLKLGQGSLPHTSASLLPSIALTTCLNCPVRDSTSLFKQLLKVTLKSRSLHYLTILGTL